MGSQPTFWVTSLLSICPKPYSVLSGLGTYLFLSASFNPLGILFAYYCPASHCIQAWINLSPQILLSKFFPSFPNCRIPPCFLLRIPRPVRFNADLSISSTCISCYLAINHALFCYAKLLTDNNIFFSFSYVYVLFVHIVSKIFVAETMSYISLSFSQHLHKALYICMSSVNKHCLEFALRYALPLPMSVGNSFGGLHIIYLIRFPKFTK